MSRLDYRTLINQGRKAGLKTSEMYSALQARQPGASEGLSDRADSNGYVPTYGLSGQRVFTPLSDRVRP